MLQKNVSLEKLIMGSLGILNYLSTKKVRFWLNVWHPKKTIRTGLQAAFCNAGFCCQSDRNESEIVNLQWITVLQMGSHSIPKRNNGRCLSTKRIKVLAAFLSLTMPHIQ